MSKFEPQIFPQKIEKNNDDVILFGLELCRSGLEAKAYASLGKILRSRYVALPHKDLGR